MGARIIDLDEYRRRRCLRADGSVPSVPAGRLETALDHALRAIAGCEKDMRFPERVDRFRRAYEAAQAKGRGSSEA